MKHKCKFCSYETDNSHGYAGHMKIHKKKEVPEKPTVAQPTASDIADALLQRVVNVVTDYDTNKAVVKSYTSENARLKLELQKAVEEKERILKVHNELVKQANKRGETLPDTEQLMHLAKLRN